MVDYVGVASSAPAFVADAEVACAAYVVVAIDANTTIVAFVDPAILVAALERERESERRMLIMYPLLLLLTLLLFLLLLLLWLHSLLLLLSCYVTPPKLPMRKAGHVLMVKAPVLKLIKPGSILDGAFMEGHNTL